MRVRASVNQRDLYKKIELFVRDDHVRLLNTFFQQNPESKEDFYLGVEVVPESASEAAWGLFCQIIDRIVEVQSGRVTKSESRQLRHHLYEECGIEAKKPEEFSKQEMWELIQEALWWAEEAGAYIQDLWIENPNQTNRNEEAR